MPNARMSLCTQSVHSLTFPPRHLRTPPSRFPNTSRFGSRPPLIRMSAPDHKKVFSCTTLSQCSHTMSSRVYLLFPPRGHEPPLTLRDHLNPHLSFQRRRFPILPALCQMPGCRSVRNRSTPSPSHPVIFALHPQGFRTRVALAAARRSFG